LLTPRLRLEEHDLQRHRAVAARDVHPALAGGSDDSVCRPDARNRSRLATGDRADESRAVGAFEDEAVRVDDVDETCALRGQGPGIPALGIDEIDPTRVAGLLSLEQKMARVRQEAGAAGAKRREGVPLLLARAGRVLDQLLVAGRMEDREYLL